MYSGAIKIRAQALRASGKSLTVIVKTLKVSKSIVRVWTKNIILSKIQQRQLDRIRRHAGIIAFAKNARTRHRHHETLLTAARAQGKKDTESLSHRDLFMLGLGLYWGEGYKKGSTELGLTNTDPKLLIFYIAWLKRCFAIGKDRLILRVSINSVHRHREKEVLHYWSHLLNVPLTQFSKTSFVKTKQKRIYLNARIHYGTLRIKARRGSVIRERILAALHSV